jgi:tRNA(Ile2) C34 agmatinyltransferase TiaS
MPACPICPGSGNLLGALGRTKHYRCRDCGAEFSRTPKACKAAKVPA